jgi:propanol-preferring alcohol dehydrogenase
VKFMKAMLLERLGKVERGATPLCFAELPNPEIGEQEVLVRVHACGVCHTELDEIEGRLPPRSLPIVLGHQVVGRIAAVGAGIPPSRVGDRVGVAWIYSACGHCAYCESGRENLCREFQATGRDHHGGYAEYLAAPETSVVDIPDGFSDLQAAPLLCAGAIGYRSLRLTNLRNGQRLGLTGFGASAHLVLKMVRYRYPDTEVFVFARSESERQFAQDLGASWAGDTRAAPPAPLDAIIDTTPAWTPILAALENLAPGGRLVVNAIRKEEADKAVLLETDYARHWWLEKEVKSVANVTRQDVREFLQMAAELQLHPRVQVYPLAQANEALIDLKTRAVAGAKVLAIGEAT